MTNTIVAQPAAVSLLTTDYFLTWQGSQSPSTRKTPVSALTAYYARLAGTNTFTARQTISSGGIGVTGNSTVTGSLTVTSGETITGNVSITGGGLNVTGGASTVPLRGYISGLTLSNDGVSPNSVLDVSAGFCTNSTNTTSISLGAFTKSTAGTWAAGSGANGMGNGLGIGASTWYHVFAIINGGSADIYFDNNPNAPNAPAGTTAFRRIGSFITDVSGHISPFFQIGDEFYLATEFTTVNSATFSSTPTLFSVISPAGLNCIARMRVQSGNSASAWTSTLYFPSVTVTGAPLLSSTIFPQVAACSASIMTNTSSQVTGVHTASALGSLVITSTGWVDTRGAFL